MTKVRKVILKMKQFVIVVKTNFTKQVKRIMTIISDFHYEKSGPLLTKIGDVLTHNVIIRKKQNVLVLFSFIKIKITNRRREAFLGIMFISLWLIGYLWFTLYPTFYSLYLSFNRAFFNLQTGITTTPTGFSNFQNVLSDSTLLPLFIDYVSRMVLSVPLIIVFSLIISMLINQPIKGKGFWRTIFFLPVVISTGPVITELIAQNATTLPSLSQNSGVMNMVMNNLTPFLANPIEALFNSMLYVLWYAGIPILIFLAGLQKIDAAIYEAASIDGASPWSAFWKITLPSIRPLISVNIIYIVVSMSLYVAPGGILDLARTHMISGGPESMVWRGYGYAAAISWVYFITMVLIILLFVGLMSIRREKRRV